MLTLPFYHVLRLLLFIYILHFARVGRHIRFLSGFWASIVSRFDWINIVHLYWIGICYGDLGVLYNNMHYVVYWYTCRSCSFSLDMPFQTCLGIVAGFT